MPSINESAFWYEEDDDLWEEIATLALAIYLLGIDGGMDLLPANIRVLSDFGKINHAAAQFAKDYRFQWIKGITETTKKQTQEAFANWVQSGSPLSALEQLLESIFGDSRAERIAVTEVTRIFAQANMDAWESTGVITSAVWMTAEDDRVCPICEGYAGEHVGIGDIDSAPPDASHPGCRCWLQPVVSEEKLQEEIERMLNE